MLGIIIANWNGEELIGDCLESIKDINAKKIIVENGSTDKSINIINKYLGEGVECIQLQTNTGFAKANNIGIDRAIELGCKYILTLNNDTKVEKKAIEKAINEISNAPEYDIFQLMMVNFFDYNICDSVGITWDEKLLPTQLGYKQEIEQAVEMAKNIKGACAGACIYSVKALQEIKLKNNDYFDSEFFAYYEDVDLAIRLYKKGYKTKLLKNVVVYHVHSATGSTSNGFKEYYLFRNMLLYTKRNQSEKEYEKYKWTYYKIIIANIKKNIFNAKIRNSLIKALLDGIKMSKKIEGDV